MLHVFWENVGRVLTGNVFDVGLCLNPGPLLVEFVRRRSIAASS
jgi:hypothetical protein